MRSIVDICALDVSESQAVPGPLPTTLIPEFASLVRGCRNAEELLTGAARFLAAALPYPQVLIMVCAGRPPRAGNAVGLGWGKVSAKRLGTTLMGLPQFAGWDADGVGGARQRDCEISELNGSANRELSDAFASAGQSRAFAEALSVRYPLRGHVVVALLSTPEPTHGLDQEVRCLLSVAFSILATALEFALRKREYARRLKQIRRAKVAWEGTVDALPQIVCVLDQEGTVTRANRAIETWGLGSVTSAAFGTLHDLLHPGCVDSECGLAKRLATTLARGVGTRSQQFEHADPVLGRELRIKIGCVNALSAQNERKGRGRRFAVVEDVTREQVAHRKVFRINQELKRTIEHHSLALTTTHEYLRATASELADARVELDETRRRHRLVLENTNAGLLMVQQGRVAYCNDRFEQLLGYSRGELAGAAIEDLFPPGCRPAQTVCCVDGEPVTLHERVCQVTRKDGATIWLRRAEVGMFAENDYVQFITVINVTDQILAERAMQVSRRTLQRLSRSLISSQEDERKRIAGELHDGLGQSLSAVKLMLQNVVSDFGGQMDDRLEGQLLACVSKTQEMVDDVRRLSMALRPAIIDSGGVLLGLTRLCRELKDTMRGLEVHWTTDVEERDVDEALKIHVFRIVQEALNNVIKHSKARNVWIQLDRCDAAIRLIIRDDGVGFDPEEMEAPARGLGLSSIKQRASLYNGQLSIDSERGRGTTVCAIWGSTAAALEGPATPLAVEHR
jgi:PAS domain S-box-containing protein